MIHQESVGGPLADARYVAIHYRTHQRKTRGSRTRCGSSVVLACVISLR